MPKQIKLTHGQFAVVDDDKFDVLNQFHWQAQRRRQPDSWYAVRADRLLGKRRKLYMHCEIMGYKGVDHIDGNGLNNQASNLRRASNIQNSFNKSTPKNNTSGYKGVSWHKATGKWMAHIGYDFHKIHLGLFDTPVDAARVYDAKAKELYGEFARLNLVESPIS